MGQSEEIQHCPNEPEVPDFFQVSDEIEERFRCNVARSQPPFRKGSKFRQVLAISLDGQSGQRFRKFAVVYEFAREIFQTIGHVVRPAFAEVYDF